MKKFSTAGLLFAFVSTLAPLSVHAQAPAPGARPATSASSAGCAFLPNAPDQHLVVRGDTLWDISGKFLQHPWCWPQVWGLNRDQIRNPHWIYPGQIVYFDRTAGRLRLGSPAGPGGQDLRLSPKVRSSSLAGEAIPSIPGSAIEPFLSQPLVIEENQLQFAPRIVASQEGRVFLGKGDKAYVQGDLKGATSFQVFRPGGPLVDPETRAILGYEARYLGTVALERAGTSSNEAHRFIVSDSKEEMGTGDRLIALPPTPILNYVPHVPERAVAARIVSVYGGVTQAGRNNVVAINRGRQQGLDVGSVLELYRYGTTIEDRTSGERQMVKLPDEKYGTLFIFRTFEQVSYGLIMRVIDAVQIGDIARSP